MQTKINYLVSSPFKQSTVPRLHHVCCSLGDELKFEILSEVEHIQKLQSDQKPVSCRRTVTGQLLKARLMPLYPTVVEGLNADIFCQAKVSHKCLEQQRISGGEADIQQLSDIEERVQRLVGPHVAFPVAAGSVDPAGGSIGAFNCRPNPSRGLRFHEQLLSYLSYDVYVREKPDTLL